MHSIPTDEECRKIIYDDLSKLGMGDGLRTDHSKIGSTTLIERGLLPGDRAQQVEQYENLIFTHIPRIPGEHLRDAVEIGLNLRPGYSGRGSNARLAQLANSRGLKLLKNKSRRTHQLREDGRKALAKLISEDIQTHLSDDAAEVGNRVVSFADNVFPIVRSPRTGSKEMSQVNIGSQDAPDIIITNPQGLRWGKNRYKTFENWLAHPIARGDSGGSFEYPFEGQVMSGTGGYVEISIFTNRSWPQGEYRVYDDGRFMARIFLDQGRPHLTLHLLLVLDNHTEQEYELTIR